ncbi:MAG TPA: tetratricopeptide repeat protein [Isosphaeraceae bacterium]|nr:tetratricopeptide repeat protein [Isosphaeraceae bacterium]
MPEMVQVKGRAWRVALGTVVLAVVGCGIALVPALLRLFPEPLTQGRRAYDRGDWAAATRSAREALKARVGDPAALRLLARSSVHLGRDDTAIAIYTQRLDDKAIQAEDYVLMGVAMKRRGQEDLALQVWNKALEAEPVPARILDELTQLFYEEGAETGTSEYIKRHPFDQAARAAEQLGQQPGWESRGDMMLGVIRGASNDVPGAAEAFRRVLDRDPKVADNTPEPVKLRKRLARTFLRVGRPAEARPHLQALLARGPDPEVSWLLSRVYLQQGATAETQGALVRAGSYRSDNPLEEEPSPYVGEARCQKCHPAIFEQSLASRHTQTYYRGAQLRALPRPDRPLRDPTDPKVTHAIKEVDGSLWEETRVGDTVLRSLIEYAFGTSDRYLTMVSHDARDQYHIVRLSHYHTAEGRGWDRTILDVDEPTHAEDFQGRTISVRDEVVRCLYCHITYPRAGQERIGPETADRAIGCERCHGPGAHHVAAVAAGLSDLAIVNPASASPRAVTQKQCNDCHILDRNYKQDDREAPSWIRSQGAGWTWSRCNTESNGAFGCVTCHDPHKSARAFTTAQYEAKCLACHTATMVHPLGGPRPRAQVTTEPGSHVCPVDPAKGCIKCHMPVVQTTSSHMYLIDHYIRIRRSPASHRGGTTSKAVP